MHITQCMHLGVGLTVGLVGLVEGGDGEWELKGSIKPQDTSLNFLPHNDYTDKGCNKRQIFSRKTS